MKFVLQSCDLHSMKTDLLAVDFYASEKVKSPSFEKIDRVLGGELTQTLEKEKWTGKTGQSKLFYTKGKLSATYVLVVGLGEVKEISLECLRRAGARIMKVAKEIRANHISVALLGGKSKLQAADAAVAMAEGMWLAIYQFDRYKKDSNGHVPGEIMLAYDAPKKSTAKIKDRIDQVQIISSGVFKARDLINTPARDLTPLDLAEAATSLPGVTTKIYKLPEIKKMKMGSYLCVAQGSANPPAFIEMHYRPHGKIKKKIVIIGKGITFDSGGLSLKPAKFMETMKDDMSGAAAVIGLMSVISKLKPHVEVWSLVAAAENMPDANAIRPGDIVTAMNGKTIEVLNTDAEGRLTLADALYYGSQKKPDYLIDLATLTGSCVVALGNNISGIMGNSPQLLGQLIDSGKRTGENLWEFPLYNDYRKELDSPIADLKNVASSGNAGTIIAGLFLKEFINDCSWAHLDIAGPSWTETPLDYEAKGGTGVMVRTLAYFLLGI